MTRFAQSYAVWLVDYYLLATVLLALALTGIALLKQPAQRLMVTKSTLVALVLLAILCAVPGWSVVHLLAADRPPTPAESVHEEPMDSRNSRPYLSQANPVRRAEQPALLPPAADETLIKAVGPKMSWTASLAIAHVAGMGCIAVWLALGWVASVRLRKTAQTAPANVSAILRELASHNSRASKPLQIFTHDRIDVAVALGVWQPMILLPDRWANSQSHDRLQAVLAHEATHVLNCDLQCVALARILFVPLWANPLFWLTKRRLRLDQEALADAAAAEVTSRQQYAEQLVAWARDARSRPALHLSSAVGLWEGPSQLRQRISILLDEQLTVLRNCSPRWRLAAATLATAAAIGLSLITIQPGHTAPPDRSNPKNASATNPPSTGTLTIRFEYDGTPPAPKEIKEGGWRNKLDDRVMRTFNVEKRVGAKVFDESLVVGEDRGIANVLIWVRSRDIPVPSPQELPPVTIAYKQGRLSPHVLAFQAPRRLVMRNEGLEDFGFHYVGGSLLVQKGKEASFVVKPDRFPMPIASFIEHWCSGSGYVLPLAHPFAAVSDKNGVARIENLPPGKWEFQVWQEMPGWLKTADWPMGRFTFEIKPGDNDLGTVKVSPAVFNDGVSATDRATRKTDKTKDTQINIPIIVAQHVLLLNGNEITTWEEIEAKIAALPDPSSAYPEFYITHGAMASGGEKDAKPHFFELHRKYKLKGHSEGTLSARTSFRYDKIRGKADLIPDESLRVGGVVLDSHQKPVAGAEVVLITPVDDSISYKAYETTLVKGRVRNRLDEVVVDTDAEGRFAIFPPKGQKYFVLVVHPGAGFNTARDQALVEGSKVHLLPWAALVSELGPEPGAKQTASLRTQLRAEDDYPEVDITQYWSDLKRDESTNVFGFTHVPPIFPTSISRDFAESDGGAIGVSGASVSLLPGEERRLDLAPLSEKQRELLKWQKDELQKRRGAIRP